MAIVCDRCSGKDAHTVAAVFRKFDGTNRLGRSMINVEIVIICETCITELLKSFGKFKVAFMKEPDILDPKIEKS